MSSAFARKGACLAAGLVVAALAVTGCSSTDDGKSGDKITLTVATFSDFGYEPLIKEYLASHPNIEVKTRVTEFDQHHKQLATRLGAGAGTADIEAVEEGYLPQFRQSKDKFYNLADYGAKDLSAQWLPWKWQQSLADNGNFVMGLGTDMGGLALCYRSDLFKAAGLPTTRDEVSALWTSWDDYFSVGNRFTAAGTKAKWFDGVGNIYTAMLNQVPFAYFDTADAYVGDTNANVKNAFDKVAAAAANPGMSAKLDPFSQQWTVGFKQGTFATLPCPSWMLGLIKDGSGPENAGKWDIAKIPGGGGNWGGSFLTVPKQGKHPKEAYELAKFLTSPDSEAKIFQNVGSLPSQPETLKNPAVLGFKNEYFTNAPVGEIYAKSGESLQPNYRGTRDADVRPVFGRALARVEQGKQNPADAWAQAVSEAAKALAK
ncbi:sugar ABC transporter substrate-binding protein [Catellatospora sp. TT07R-123]|uniref:extracellular solute-binding protein n=1 Tax=Catellatospora sp. TT07R-123 TaxID=2733863 RepID=UPI001B2E5CDB|nr:ABC transporter substrate-binding protein [Catellatospora sp. TT07R-123]GHJ49468.1 sugar ABC transporter substrate-binding protein [Catellatospora sp. TT07R-123]